MKLKGWKKLERFIQSQVHQIDPEVEVFLSSEDGAYVESHRIGFGIIRMTEADERFMAHLYANHPKAPKFPSFIYSMLHEIGHLHTREVLEQEDKEERARLMKSNDHTAYFNFPAEVAATTWAVEYAGQNTQRMARMAEHIEAAMGEFIMKNWTPDED